VSCYDRIGLLQLVALLVFASSLAGFALSSGIVVAVISLVVAGAAEMVFASSNVTTLQMCASQKMRGRIASLLNVFPALISAGSLTSGMGADLIGPQLLVGLFAAIALCAAVAIWSNSPMMRNLRLSTLAAKS
jgi:hypothetical protein